MSYINNNPSWETIQKKSNKPVIDDKPKPKIKINTKRELFKMLVSDQKKIIRKLAPNIPIPRLEWERVKLIIDLQKNY